MTGGLVAIRADNSKQEVVLLHILFSNMKQKRYLLIKSIVARSRQLI